MQKSKSKTQTKDKKRETRHKRVRAKITGTAERPRLSIFRSANHIFLQLIDDAKGVTIISAGDSDLKPKATGRGGQAKGKKTEVSFKVAQLMAKKALDKKIKKIVFDRGGYKYHGRIKSAAEGLREGGLQL